MTDPKKLFEEIYSETKEAAYRYITAKCFDLDDIDDIYQSTFINVYDALVKRKDPVADNEAFVILIAKRTLAKYYPLAKRLRGQISLSRQDDEEDDIDLPDDIDIEDDLANKALMERINEQLKKKPVLTQKIIFMYYYRGMTIPQIAETMELGESSVKRHIYKTIEDLRRLYRKENEL